MTPTDYTDEIFAALNALAADMAVSISWPTLHQWAGSSPLAVEHLRNCCAFGSRFGKARTKAHPCRPYFCTTGLRS